MKHAPWFPGLLAAVIQGILFTACEKTSTSPTVDETAPEVRITSPANGAVLDGPVTITVSVEDESAIQLVEVLVDGALLDRDLSEPWETHWDVSFYSPETSHTIQARATDRAGNQGQSSTVTVTVDSTAWLAPSLVAPEDGAIMPQQHTIALEWTSVTGAASYELQLAEDNEFLVLSYTDEADSTTFTTPILPDNLYNWRVRGKNEAGLPGSWSEIRRCRLGHAVPELLEPEYLTEFSDSTYLVTLNWSTVPYGAQYDVAVSKTGDFSDPWFSQSTAEDTLTIDLAQNDYSYPSNGWYYRRVRVGDEIEYAGPSSSIGAFLAGYPRLVWEWEGDPRWLRGVDWGGQCFYHSTDYGMNYYGSTLSEDEYVSVEILIDSTLASDCAVYRRDLGYEYSGPGLFPGHAYDISDSDNPRRLNICFTEDNNEQPPDLTWNPGSNDVGSREYLFIMLSDYDGGIAYDDDNWGPGADVVIGSWLKRYSQYSFFESNPAILRFEIEPGPEGE